MAIHPSRIMKCLSLAAIAACLTLQMPSRGQVVVTKGLGEVLSGSERLGDPAPGEPQPPLWIRANSAMALSADGFVIYQKGERLRDLKKGHFDPSAPFCAVVAEPSGLEADLPDPGIKTGEQLTADVIPMRNNPADIGRYHLSTDLLVVRVQNASWIISFGFMWPRQTGSPAGVRRGARIQELQDILGASLDFGKGRIASPECGGVDNTWCVTASLVNFEVLVLDKDKTHALTDIQPHQFRIYEGCSPEQTSSCPQVHPVSIETAARKSGRVDFIVLPEIGGGDSHRTIIRDAVSRLVDFTQPQDRAAIVPYSERAAVWQPLTSDKQQYRAQAATLFDANVGSRSGYINTYGAVTMALTELASANPGARHVMLILTEGHDCFNPYEIAKLAAAHNASVWVLDLTGRNHAELKPLAELSGGFYFRVDGYESLLSHIEEFIRMWEKVYLISYYPVVFPGGDQAPEREIRVDGAGTVFLTVTKGFRGPQVIANMTDLQAYYTASPLSQKFLDAHKVKDLIPLIHQIESDDDFTGFVERAIGLSESTGEFLGFLDQLDHIGSGKRQKTIGHLITANLDGFAAMAPGAKDWLRLRSRVGHAEDWKRVTGVLLPRMTDAGDFLGALSVADIPETAGYTEGSLAAMVGETAVAQVQHFVSLHPTASQKDSFLSLLPAAEERVRARRAFGALVRQLAPDIARAFQESQDSDARLSVLEGFLRSTTGPGEFAEIMDLYPRAGQPGANAVASVAILNSLKTWASLPSPQEMIPVALKNVRDCLGRVAVVRELQGSIDQINQLKEDQPDQACLIATYLLAARRARSAADLSSALAPPVHRQPIEYEQLRERLIQSLLPEFKTQARSAEQYLALAGEAQAIELKTEVLTAGLAALTDPQAKLALQNALGQLGRLEAKQTGAGK
jgi:hypothetical protein